MTPRISMIGQFSQSRFGRDIRWRRAVFLVLIAICAALTFFPERYRAVVSLSPTDPNSLGLSSTLGQLGSVANVFGNQAALEVSLKIARSLYVRKLVAKRLDLDRKLGKTSLQTDRWLERRVVIRSLRGGILQFELLHSDPDFALSVVNAYSDAVSKQLGIVARKQIETKRDILLDLVNRANDRLTRAQEAYDTFRLRTRYGDPLNAIEAIGDRIPLIEGEIRSKEIELAAAQQFVTNDNMRARRIVAEIGALREQLQVARSTSPLRPESVGRVVRESTQADRLSRELDISLGLYENYKRFLQGTSVEDMTSTANVRILEPPFIDSTRQINLLPLSIGLLLLLLALAVEFYALRPPLGHPEAV
jgi:tyrosine-protein kinase Etk/Wzc